MGLNANNREDLEAIEGGTSTVIYFATRHKSDGHSHPRTVCTCQKKFSAGEFVVLRGCLQT